MRKPILTVIYLCCFLVGFELAFAANAPVNAEKKRQDNLRAFRKAKAVALLQAYPGVKYRIDDERGVPRRISGKLQQGLSKGDVVQTVYEFFEKNRELYGLSDPRSELKVTRNEKNQLGTLVVLKQLYGNVEVWNTMLKANFGRDGNLYAIYGSTYPDIDLSTAPSLDSNSALEIVIRDLEFPPGLDYGLIELERFGRRQPKGRPPLTRLAIFSHRGKYHLVWVVRLLGYKTDSDWEYFIDAHTGEILEKQDLIIPIRPGPKPERKTPLIPTPRPGGPSPLPKEMPRQEFQTSGDLILLYPKDYQQDPAVQLDSVQAGQKAREDTMVRSEPTLHPSETQAAEDWRKGSPDIKEAEPVEVKLQIPMDSLIKRKMRQPVEKAGKKKQEKTDSPQTNATAAPATFVNIMTEGFEGFFPEESPNWITFDNDVPPEFNGEIYWDDDNFLAWSGSWSGWCAGGGSSGVPGSNNYANNMNSWMVYGPFSLTDATDAELNFRFWLKSEYQADFVWWGASPNCTTVYFSGATGNSSTAPGNVNGWLYGRLPLDSVPLPSGGYLNLLGRSYCCIAFAFTSNGSIVDKGAFIDEIILKKDVPAGGTPNLYAGYIPPDWDGPIVVSCVSGTKTQSLPRVNQTAYIDWAVKNDGSRATSTVTLSTLIVDGVTIRRYGLLPPLNPGSTISVPDVPYVFATPGWHRVTIIHDSLNSEAEDFEFDNRWDYDFEVTQTGHNVGTGFGVLANPHGHIDTECDQGTFRLRDYTRRANNNPHFHNGRMVPSAYIRTKRWEAGAEIDDGDNNNEWNSGQTAASVDAHVYAGWTYDYMNQPFKLDRNGVDGIGGIVMQNLVNDDRQGTDGAAFRYPDLMAVYAPSDSMWSFASALDVIAHEWGHGITQYESNLGISREPGALAESFGDMFGVSVGFANNDPDWELGENVFRLRVGRLRDLSHPPREGDPDTYRGQYWVKVNPDSCPTPSSSNDFCGRHTNSGVPNKMFYLFANGGFLNDITVPGIGIDNAMRVMYLANRDKWDAITDFLDARDGSIEVADSINSLIWGPALRKAWDAVRVCDKGDVDSDGFITEPDILQEVECVFQSIGCNFCSSDLNCSESFSGADIVTLINRVFNEGGDFCPPP
ncbi:MAG: M4 family metallopeptidase [candidate division Zixibacteria bacterium]|nr:M4 family metallopeptidase [candidate division Zixibacteria bacterium]